jgi:hypothetical protein
MPRAAPPGELPGRVALVRGYLSYVLGVHPGANRTATFRVIGDMIARDMPGRALTPTGWPRGGAPWRLRVDRLHTLRAPWVLDAQRLRVLAEVAQVADRPPHVKHRA